MLYLLNKLNLFAIMAVTVMVMVITTFVHALPGGLDLAAAAGKAILEERVPTAYVGVCFDNGKCDDSSGPGHNIEGDGSHNSHFGTTCNSFFSAYTGGYACKNGCGKGVQKGGCVGLTQAKCAQGGPFSDYCVKA